MKQQVNIFKNSGIRGIANPKNNFWIRFIESITPKSFITFKNISFLASSISIYLQEKYENECNILIATDTRPSGQWIKKCMISSFKEFNNHIFDAGIVPTPCFAKTLQQYKEPNSNNTFFHLGIMITASHNPAQYNGIKIMTPTGYLTEEDELYISKIFNNLIKNPELILRYFNLSIRPETKIFNSCDLYITNLKDEIKPFKSNSKIIIDCANGATYDIAFKIFSNYFDNIILINNSSDGNLINHNSGCTNPSLLIQAIKENNADWACAFDGDGDRIIIADKQENIYDGDDILFVLSNNDRFKNEKIFIGTIMSNMAIEKYFANQDKTLIRTDVGERNLIDALEKYNAQIGSEPCGHITIMDHAKCSDGIFTALLFFQTIFSNESLLKNKYKKYQQIHENINLNSIKIDDKKIKDVIEFYQNKNLQDERIIIRKSNTEPILRIMVENKDYNNAKKTVEEIKNRFINNS